MGRPSTVTRKLPLGNYMSVVSPFTHGGGYISMPQETIGKRVIIKVLKEGDS